MSNVRSSYFWFRKKFVFHLLVKCACRPRRPRSWLPQTQDRYQFSNSLIFGLCRHFVCRPLLPSLVQVALSNQSSRMPSPINSSRFFFDYSQRVTVVRRHSIPHILRAICVRTLDLRDINERARFLLAKIALCLHSRVRFKRRCAEDVRDYCCEHFRVQILAVVNR